MIQSKTFHGKTVLITGSANGIGKTIAMEYAKEGANLILIDNDEAQLDKLLLDLGSYPVNVLKLVCDVSKSEDISNCLVTIDESKWSIDILINNVGIGKNCDFLDLKVEDFDLVYATNLRSTMIFSQYCARHMALKSKGAIINISSTRALMSEPGTEAYSASKGGILALTHSMAASLSKHHITVNCISPGWIHTGDANELSKEDHEQHLSQRVGKPTDISRACLYLSLENNDFINGENIVIDGGMTRKMMYIE